jgi:hypothetical protein
MPFKFLSVPIGFALFFVVLIVGLAATRACGQQSSIQRNGGKVEVQSTGAVKVTSKPGQNVEITTSGGGSVLCNGVPCEGTGGITSLNGQPEAVQTLSTQAAGTDFAVVSGGGAHVFRLPSASGTNRGALTSADWTAFNNKLGSLNGLTDPVQTFGLTWCAFGIENVTINSSGGVHLFEFPCADTDTRGFLQAGDWNTFNSKIGGSGSQFFVPVFTAAGVIGNSRIIDAADDITINSEAGRTSLGDIEGSGNETILVVDDPNRTVRPSVHGAVSLGATTQGYRQLFLDATVTTGGTTGAQTIDKSAGSVNFAASAVSLVVTNNTVTASSIVVCTVATNDATLKSVQCVPAAGSFTMFGNAAAAAETRVNFLVIN